MPLMMSTPRSSQQPGASAGQVIQIGGQTFQLPGGGGGSPFSGQPLNLSAFAASSNPLAAQLASAAAAAGVSGGMQATSAAAGGSTPGAADPNLARLGALIVANMQSQARAVAVQQQQQQLAMLQHLTQHQQQLRQQQQLQLQASQAPASQPVQPSNGTEQAMQIDG